MSLARQLATGSVAALLEQARQALAGGDSPDLDAQLLLARALGRSRAWLYAHPEALPDAAQCEHFAQLLAARQAGRPMAYILGEREFHGLRLQVDESVLIPRPDTELLVELALALDLPPAARVADLGTGSGAIALALALARPQWRILASDNSAAALAVAQRNAAALELAQVDFRLGSWCAVLEGNDWDLLLSNPPYIAPDDVHLETGDLRFEPRSALVAGEAGLADLRALATQARVHLRSGGQLLLEHGWQQGEAVRELLRAAGYAEVRSYRDLAGHERVSGGIQS